MPNLRTRLIRLAHANPDMRADLLMLIAHDMAKTPAGAKKLYEKYIKTLEDPSKSKKSPKDFYDSKGGKDDHDVSETDEEWDAANAKYKKEQTKKDKGDAKTTKKQKDWRGKRKTYKNLENSAKNEIINRGRRKGLEKVKSMSHKELGKSVQEIAESVYGKAELEYRATGISKRDPDGGSRPPMKGWDDPLKALADLLAYHRNPTSAFSHGEVYYGREEPRSERLAEEKGEHQAMISQYIKREKARRKKDGDKGERPWGKPKSKKASVRNQLIKLAYDRPDLRSKILPLLKQAGEFTEQEWKTHKQKYPGAEAKDHTITKGDEKKDKAEDKAEDKPKSKIKAKPDGKYQTMDAVSEIFGTAVHNLGREEEEKYEVVTDSDGNILSSSQARKQIQEARAIITKAMKGEGSYRDLAEDAWIALHESGSITIKNKNVRNADAANHLSKTREVMDEMEEALKPGSELSKRLDSVRSGFLGSNAKKKTDSKGDKGDKPKKEKTKAELLKDYKDAIQKSKMSPEDKKKALENAKKPNFDPEAALGAMGDDDEEDGGKKAFRSQLIRLAHDKPHLRGHLLPLFKTAGRDMPRLDWMIPEATKNGAKEETFADGMIRVWRWETESENRRTGRMVTKYHLLMGSGSKRAKNAMVWEYHSSASSRDSKVDRIVANYERRAREKAQAREDAKNFQHGYQIGDILYSSWGYDQTNVDFYQVTKLIGAKMIEIQEIQGKVVKSDRGADYVVAVKDRFVRGERPLKKKVNTRRSVKINSHTNAYPWDGKPKYQTSAYAGH